MEEHREGLDFTMKAWDVLYDSVDDERFRDADAETIYDALSARELLVSFGDYLKRYICEKAELNGSEDQLTLNDYQTMIRDSFADRGTPRSFRETTAKMSMLTRNWLTQRAVKREVVFLLGFGLGMSTADVDGFLSKAIGERGINPKNPYEVMCWYCYENGYPFEKYRKLRERFEHITPEAPGRLSAGTTRAEQTVLMRRTLQGIHDENSLLAYLRGLKTDDNRPLFSVTARLAFERLYDRTRELIARMYSAERNRPCEKDEITPADLEHVLCAAIPTDRHGNLAPAKASALNRQFEGKRLSRQHIGEVLAGRTEVTRFDLITLNFFVFSQADTPNPQKRFTDYIESTNRILESSLMGELYVQNAYECFVLMCMLSEDPLCAYSDVWALSYEQEPMT